MVFQLYALLKIHLAEEEAYMRIVEKGVTADVAEMLAAAMDHPGARPPDGDRPAGSAPAVAPSLYAPGAHECIRQQTPTAEIPRLPRATDDRRNS